MIAYRETPRPENLRSGQSKGIRMDPSVKSDLLVQNGTVITMEDPVRAAALDIAVKDGLVLDVAPRGTLDDRIGPHTRVLDAAGRVVLPGLIDSHNHMTLFGSNLDSVEVSPARVSRMQELLDALSERAGQTPPGHWVTAWGYDDTRLDEEKHPFREDLDRACPDHPVRLMRTCMHIMAVNSRALQMAGVDEATPDPAGGEIGRDSTGRPNGLLKEIGAMNLVNRLIPWFSSQQVADHLGLASTVYVSQGLTLVCEAGAGWTGNPNEAAAFQLARLQGKLLPRVCMGLMEETYRLHPAQGGTGLFTGFGDRRLWLGPAKFVADGGIGARTAALKQPYEGSDYCGVLCEAPDSLYERMKAAHLGGFQLSIHAIGDRTIEMVVELYEKLLKEHPRAHRHRLEHAAVCPPDLVRRMADLQLVPVVQPAFLHYLGDSFLENLGPQRIPFTIPLKTMIEAGLAVVGSSDRPVTEGNPWTGIWSAVTRTTVGGNPIGADQRIGIQEALKMWTVNAAWANHAEQLMGTISPGKLADLVCVDENPLDCEPERLRSIRTVKTLVGGKEVFSQ